LDTCVRVRSFHPVSVKSLVPLSCSSEPSISLTHASHVIGTAKMVSKLGIVILAKCYKFKGNKWKFLCSYRSFELLDPALKSNRSRRCGPIARDSATQESDAKHLKLNLPTAGCRTASTVLTYLIFCRQAEAAKATTRVP
jgi:hypothetical protein